MQEKFLVNRSGDIGQQASPNPFQISHSQTMQLSRNFRPYQKMRKDNLRERARGVSYGMSIRSRFLTIREGRGQCFL